MNGLLLSDELMFNSRITGAAQASGVTIHIARSQAELEKMAGEQPPRCVIVDLANPGLDIAVLVQHLAALDGGRPYIVAYGSHVDTATLKKAREAGCDVVWPRSKFVEELPAALAGWFSA